MQTINLISLRSYYHCDRIKLSTIVEFSDSQISYTWLPAHETLIQCLQDKCEVLKIANIYVIQILKVLKLDLQCLNNANLHS